MSDPRWDADLRTDGVRVTAARAVAWSAASQAGRQVLQFLVVPLLAALLSRDDFGLVAMATVVVSLLSALNDIGARSALQRESRLTEPLVAGVFWLNVALGAGCSALTAALAWPVAWAYGEPRLVGVLLALAPSFLLASLGFVSLSLLQRRLLQRRLSAVELAASVAGAGAALLAASAGAGPYSLVVQSLVSAAVTTALALALAPVPALAGWRLDDVRPVLGYSVNLAAFGAINAFARSADYVLLGRFAGAEITGLYYLAYRLVVDPVSQVAGVIGRVALPVLATVQDDPPRLRAWYLKAVGAIAAATFPATLGVLAVRHELLAVLGAKWAAAAILIVLLVPVGLVQALLAPLGNLYQVRGRTDLMLRVGAASAAVLVAALAVGVRWNAAGVAAAYSLAMAAMAAPILVVPLRLVGLPARRVLAEVARPAACAVLMAVLVTALRPVVSALAPVPALLVLVGAGVAAHLAATLALDRARLREVLELAAARR